MKKDSLVASVLILAVMMAIGAGAFALTRKQVPTTDPGTNQMQQNTRYTTQEVARHNTSSDCWTIISEQVYDLTEFINRHPGGSTIVQACGIDATSLFTERQKSNGEPVGSGTPHSKVAQSQLSELKIGTLTTPDVK